MKQGIFRFRAKTYQQLLKAIAGLKRRYSKSIQLEMDPIGENKFRGKVKLN